MLASYKAFHKKRTCCVQCMFGNLVLPEMHENLVLFSPSKMEQSCFICRIGNPTGGEESVWDVISTTRERQRLVGPNICLHPHECLSYLMCFGSRSGFWFCEDHSHCTVCSHLSGYTESCCWSPEMWYVESYHMQKCIRAENHSSIGQNHPGHMGEQLSSIPPPPTPSSLKHHDSHTIIS